MSAVAVNNYFEELSSNIAKQYLSTKNDKKMFNTSRGPNTATSY